MFRAEAPPEISPTGTAAQTLPADHQGTQESRETAASRMILARGAPGSHSPRVCTSLHQLLEGSPSSGHQEPRKPDCHPLSQLS